MAILKYLPKIKVEYLQAILDDRELYKEVAIEVKQQIWQDNQVKGTKALFFIPNSSYKLISFSRKIMLRLIIVKQFPYV